MRILIGCANELEVAELLAEISRVAPDWQASEYGSVRALETLLAQDHYAVVVCDLELLSSPTLQELQRITVLAPDTYFVVLASRDSQLLGARALSAGADYHVIKYGRWINELLLVIKRAEEIINSHQETRHIREFNQCLLDLATVLTTEKDLTQQLDAIAQAVMSIMEAEHCWIGVLNQEGNEFEDFHSYGRTDREAPDWETPIRDIAWRSLHHKELLIDQIDETGSTPRRVIALPMVLENGPVGALAMVKAAATPLGEPHRNALQFLCALTAVLIYNERLNRRLQRRGQQIEAAATQAWDEEARARTVLNAAVAVTDSQQPSEVLEKIATNAAVEIGFDRVSIYLTNDDQSLLRGTLQATSDGGVDDISDRDYLLKPGDNLLADAACGKAPYVLLGPEDHDEAAIRGAEGGYPQLLVPLHTHGDLVGLLVADNHQTHTPIPPQRIRLLRSLAAMAAVALERIRMDKLRELFVSSISHELRTPLSSLQATSELLSDEEVGPLNQDQHQYLARMASACGHMRRILDDLTDWSHLQAGRIAIRKRKVDLRQTVEYAMQTLHSRAEQAGVEISLKLPPDSLEVFTDPRRIEQVLINLVDNAVKFNYHRGQVEVLAFIAEGEAVAQVSDTGPGIPAEIQDRIFKPFDRGSEEISRPVEGVGLGLAIASQITKLLGGRIEVSSKLGQGSTFSVHLPLEGDSNQQTGQ